VGATLGAGFPFLPGENLAPRSSEYRQAREYDRQDQQERNQQELWELHRAIENER